MAIVQSSELSGKMPEGKDVFLLEQEHKTAINSKARSKKGYDTGAGIEKPFEEVNGSFWEPLIFPLKNRRQSSPCVPFASRVVVLFIPQRKAPKSSESQKTAKLAANYNVAC